MKIKTVGDLRARLANLPDTLPVQVHYECVCMSDDIEAYLAIEEPGLLNRPKDTLIIEV